MNILIVDDDQDLADSLADSFELTGHKAHMAFTGEEAIEKHRGGDFDITIMDIKLPGMNGVESFMEIRKIKPYAKVIMMTVYSVRQLMEEAIEGGALGVLNKPFCVSQVLEMFEQIRPHGILIADDDPDFIDSIRDLLAENGYTVYVANDGKMAVEQVKSNSIDVMILDIRMPLLNGFEVYLELKKSGFAIPTIIVTAFAREEEEDLNKLLKLSLTGILVKPFDPEDLLRAVKAFTRTRK
ncbi:MAG: response regulator [Planctomycetes bacterium]|nr:response regulator [Planctomycetota bacterium]